MAEQTQNGNRNNVQAAFPPSKKKKTGYRRDQVDALLERARQSYEGTIPPEQAVTAKELRATSFDLQRNGYSARFVDAALDRLEDVFFERERRAAIREVGRETWAEHVRTLALELHGRVTQPKRKRFRSAGFITHGYKRSQVDAFLDRVAAFLDGRGSLSTTEVREVMFHSELRGYSEDQVDAFLDSVIELILSRR